MKESICRAWNMPLDDTHVEIWMRASLKERQNTCFKRFRISSEKYRTITTVFKTAKNLTQLMIFKFEIGCVILELTKCTLQKKNEIEKNTIKWSVCTKSAKLLSSLRMSRGPFSQQSLSRMCYFFFFFHILLGLFFCNF